MSTPASTDSAARSLKRARVCVITVFLIVFFTIYVNAISRSTELFGIAGFVALLSGPVLYYVFRAVYGGPAGPSSEAGNDALALAEAEAAKDAA